MSHTKCDFVPSFYSLPHDIVIDSIIPLLNFTNVENILASSNVYKNKKNVFYNNVISNHKFLNRYITKRDMNLITTIHHSSFTIKHFFKMFDNINDDVKADDTILHIYPNPIGYCGRNSRYEISEICIDATFELFKILQCLVMYHLKFQFRNFITSRLIKYFKNVFDARYNKKKTDACKNIFINFITKRDELMWHLSNVNLYYMYENINLFKYAKRSYALKYNINSFDDGYLLINNENHVNTLSLLINIFKNMPAKEIELKIYSLYKIFKYINIILLKDREKILIDDNFKLAFVTIVRQKIEEFKTDIQDGYRSLFPRFVKQTMLKKVNLLLTRMDEYV